MPIVSQASRAIAHGRCITGCSIHVDPVPIESVTIDGHVTKSGLPFGPFLGGSPSAEPALLMAVVAGRDVRP